MCVKVRLDLPGFENLAGHFKNPPARSARPGRYIITLKNT